MSGYKRGRGKGAHHEGGGNHLPGEPPPVEGPLGADRRSRLVEAEVHKAGAVPAENQTTPEEKGEGVSEREREKSGGGGEALVLARDAVLVHKDVLDGAEFGALLLDVLLDVHVEIWFGLRKMINFYII